MNRSDVLANTDTYEVFSRATKIVRIYILGKKFSRTGVITYENGGTVPKFFYYHVLCYAYSNYSTSELAAYYVGRVNDYIQQLYYKDA